MVTDTKNDSLPTPDLPMLTFFYGVLTRQRVNNEADRLTKFARAQVAKGKATEPEFRQWCASREEWRKHWLSEVRVLDQQHRQIRQ